MIICTLYAASSIGQSGFPALRLGCQWRAVAAGGGAVVAGGAPSGGPKIGIFAGSEFISSGAISRAKRVRRCRFGLSMRRFGANRGHGWAFGRFWRPVTHRSVPVPASRGDVSAHVGGTVPGAHSDYAPAVAREWTLRGVRGRATGGRAVRPTPWRHSASRTFPTVLPHCWPA